MKRAYTIRCTIHPHYEGERKPKNNCNACWLIHVLTTPEEMGKTAVEAAKKQKNAKKEPFNWLFCLYSCLVVELFRQGIHRSINLEVQVAPGCVSCFAHCADDLSLLNIVSYICGNCSHVGITRAHSVAEWMFY